MAEGMKILNVCNFLNMQYCLYVWQSGGYNCIICAFECACKLWRKQSRKRPGNGQPEEQLWAKSARGLFSLQEVYLVGDQVGSMQSGLERKPGVCLCTGERSGGYCRILEPGAELLVPVSSLMRAPALLSDQRPLPSTSHTGCHFCGRHLGRGCFLPFSRQLNLPSTGGAAEFGCWAFILSVLFWYCPQF